MSVTSGRMEVYFCHKRKKRRRRRRRSSPHSLTHTPSSASISRIKCPFPIPPNDGLQDISPAQQQTATTSCRQALSMFSPQCSLTNRAPFVCDEERAQTHTSDSSGCLCSGVTAPDYQHIPVSTLGAHKSPYTPSTRQQQQPTS